MNIFRKKHTVRGSGENMAIISMEADHLMATLNVLLRKNINKAVEAQRNILTENAAPELMPKKQARTLGLRYLSGEELDDIEHQLDDFETEVFEKALEYAIPYIVVGIVREDTRDGVIAILQDAMGEFEGPVQVAYEGSMYEKADMDMNIGSTLSDEIPELSASVVDVSDDDEDEFPF